MTRLRQLYDLAVRWLLDVCAPRVHEAIYKHGHEDGMTELRDFMRRELTAVQVTHAAAYARAYNSGFSDAMRLYGDMPRETPTERVM
jgi:hypothetical protein